MTETSAGRAAELDRYAAALGVSIEAREAAEADVATALGTAAAHEADRASAARDLEEIARARAAIEEAAAEHAARAERLEALLRAEGAAAATAAAHEAATEALRSVDADLAPLPAPAVVEAEDPEALGAAEEAVTAALRALVRVEQEADEAEALDAAARRAAEGLEIATLEHKAWGVVVDALGPRGIPLYEIDALGPELTAIANDLLHACHGPQFTISVDTERPTADGKGTVEEVMIWVYDTETMEPGDRRDAKYFNHGARFFLGLAVSLAFTAIVCARAGAVLPTIVRDEHASVISPGNRTAAIAMLRRAADIIGAKHLLIVTHDTAFAEETDCAVVIADGKIEILCPVRLG